MRDELPDESRRRLRQDARRLSETIRNGMGFDEQRLMTEFEQVINGYDNELQTTIFSELLRSLIAAASEKPNIALTIEAWTKRFRSKSRCIVDAFSEETVEVYQRRCLENAQWFENIFPDLQAGRYFARFGAELFGKMLAVYVDSRRCDGARDLPSECWSLMSKQFRTRPYVTEFCRYFKFPLPGEAIDKYELDSPHGVGGMGVVYRAAHSDGYIVALKMLRPDRSHCLDLFSLEARATFQATDRRFVAVKDSDLTCKTPFFTMDFVEGGLSLAGLIQHPHEFKSISNKLRDKYKLRQPRNSFLKIAQRFFWRVNRKSHDQHSKEPRVEERLLAVVVKQAASAVQKLHVREGHSGLLHTDIKPGNILISADLGVLVGDLGLCLESDTDGVWQRTERVGTEQYMSPEQLNCNPMTPASDVYQLGGLLFRGLTGHAPGQAYDPSLLSAAPRRLRAICKKTLSSAPTKRYASASSLAVDLDRYLDGMPVAATGPGLTVRTTVANACRSNLFWLTTVTVIVLLGLVSRFVRQNTEYIPGVAATKNKYRTSSLLKEPKVLVVDSAWEPPSYDHVRILGSSICMDLRSWKNVRDWEPVETGLSPWGAGEVHQRKTTLENLEAWNAGRVEPAFYTRVIRLRKLHAEDQSDREYQNERCVVSFQFRTGGFGVDLECSTHPHNVLGSRGRTKFGEYDVKVRQIDIDITEDDSDVVVIVINGIIWNGFQVDLESKTQWASFLSSHDSTEGEIAIIFPKDYTPKIEAANLFRRDCRTKNRESLKPEEGLLDNPEGTSWWLWRPGELKADYIYQIEFPWSPKTKDK